MVLKANTDFKKLVSFETAECPQHCFTRRFKNENRKLENKSVLFNFQLHIFKLFLQSFYARKLFSFKEFQ